LVFLGTKCIHAEPIEIGPSVHQRCLGILDGHRRKNSFALPTGRSAEVVEPCNNGTDLRLTSGFEKAWYGRMDTIDSPNRERLARALDSSPDQLSFERYGDALLVHTDDEVIAQWDSNAAVVADLAAAGELARRSSEWSVANPVEKARVLTSLRVFIEDCPTCDGSVAIEQEVVESCCRSYDMVAAACSDCEAQLFEIEWSDELASGEPITQGKQQSSRAEPTAQ
jgi:hypothetical protein